MIESNAVLIASLRKHVFSFPVLNAIENQDIGLETLMQMVPIAPINGDLLYVQGHSDRVVVIFALSAPKLESDAVLMKHFLKEMADARALPAHQSAPSFILNSEQPKELENVSTPSGKKFHYVTFGKLFGFVS
jgi:hypothetical protein